MWRLKTNGGYMKVIHVAETITGGVATVINELILNHANLFPEIESRCYIPQSQATDITSLPEKKIDSYHRSGRNFLSYMRFIFGLIGVVIKYKPNVIHLHSTYAGVLGRYVLIFIRPIINFKVVYCPHGWSFDMEIDSWKKSFYEKLEKLSALFCDRIICISDYEYRLALNHGFSEHKLTVVKNGVAYIDGSDSGKKNNEKISLLFVGRFDRQKGFDILLDSFKKLDPKKFDLVVAGGGILEADKHYSSLMNELDIEYKGWVTATKLPDLYKCADLLIMPSRWEGFGLVAVEALAQGTPVMASNVGGLSEIVIDGFNGYHVLPNVDSIVERIRFISKTDLNKIRVNCYASYAENYTAIRMACDTQKLYISLF